MSRPTQPMALMILFLYPLWMAAAEVRPISGTVTAAPAAKMTQSVQSLALSVDGLGTRPALLGTARRVTITNSSTTVTALSVAYYSTSLPAGTTITSNATPKTACGNIASGDTCVLTITPGSTASAEPYDLNPTPITLTIVGTNTNTLTVQVNILTYGSVYQSGYVYSIDDSTPVAGSVGGKVVALVDQKPAGSNRIAWDADPACGSPLYHCTQQTKAWDKSHGENLAAVPGSLNSSGTGTNGPGDTYQIFSVLNGHHGNTNSPANYAASVCTTYAGGGYVNWYLPSICEMGPASNGSGCPARSQNMVSNLPSLLSKTLPCTTPAGCLAGGYWSSTEYSGNANRNYAWGQGFSAQTSDQSDVSKDYLMGVRCSRNLSP